MDKLLLHVCCGPCSTNAIEMLTEDNDVVIYFFNPNIYPEEEYERRLKAGGIVSGSLGLVLIEGSYNPKVWDDAVKGLEKEPERGKRCEACFRMRLEEAARYAKEHGFDCFATTLTTSPHKDAKLINMIGKEIEKKFGIRFLELDLKKQDGFRKSNELAKKLGIYRQDYCGCRYSMGHLENASSGKQ